MAVLFKQRRKPHHTTNKLRILRAERRWTQDDVAYKLGFGSKFRYWQIENEEVVPTKSERRKLAKVFGVPDDVIFPQSHALAS